MARKDEKKSKTLFYQSILMILLANHNLIYLVCGSEPSCVVWTLGSDAVLDNLDICFY